MYHIQDGSSSLEASGGEGYGSAVTNVGRTGTRDIARAAVKAELAQVAFDLVRREGFENVTINDLAAAAGVSRSTFLRYFPSKEDAVLGPIDAQGELFADAVRSRPADEDDWTTLRRALDVVIEPYRQDPDAALATTRIIQEAPSLAARQMEKQHSWRPVLTQALADRGDYPEPVPVSLEVKATTALVCLSVALDHWTASGGQLDLINLLDDAFSAFAPQ
jgi:AcrR family transcriptional regulator